MKKKEGIYKRKRDNNLQPRGFTETQASGYVALSPEEESDKQAE